MLLMPQYYETLISVCEINRRRQQEGVMQWVVQHPRGRQTSRPERLYAAILVRWAGVRDRVINGGRGAHSTGAPGASKTLSDGC